MGEQSPEARLETKLKAMEAARSRRSLGPLLPDLDSLPQSGARRMPGAEDGIAAAIEPLGEGFAAFAWVDPRLAPGLSSLSHLVPVEAGRAWSRSTRLSPNAP